MKVLPSSKRSLVGTRKHGTSLNSSRKSLSKSVLHYELSGPCIVVVCPCVSVCQPVSACVRVCMCVRACTTRGWKNGRPTSETVGSRRYDIPASRFAQATGSRVVGVATCSLATPLEGLSRYKEQQESLSQKNGGA